MRIGFPTRTIPRGRPGANRHAFFALRRCDTLAKTGSRKMSERALAFVEQWVSDHVRAEDKSENEQARARALADRCLADASTHGITANEVGEAIDDLTAFMIGAIEEAVERKVHAEQAEDIKPVPDLVDVEGVENAEEDALEDEEDGQH
jgi:hypothetical protein